MNHILLTGGAGYIGSHIAVNLIGQGFKVTLFDSFINSRRLIINNIKNLIIKKHPENLKNLEVCEGDLRDMNSIIKVFELAKDNNQPFSGVIHLAGLKAVGESVEDPLKYWEFNVYGSINLFKVMNSNKCKTIIFSSSATIYNPTNQKNIKENSHINPSNPYGSTKVAIEKILMEIAKSSPNKWRIINLRYFNPIGADSSGLLGELPLEKPNNIFPIILDVALDNSRKLNIYGNDWNTHDGTGVRDYIHVTDLSNGHVMALNFLLKNKPQFINLNLGTGKGTSVLELINTFEKSNNVSIPFVISERRKGDVSYTVADNTLAKELLNWYPEKNLSQMCVDGWRWKLNLIKNIKF